MKLAKGKEWGGALACSFSRWRGLGQAKALPHTCLAALALLLIAAAPDEKPKGGAGQGGQVESAVVPPYLFNVWLCRPGAESVTVSVLAWEEMEAFIEYGESIRGIPAPSDGPGMARLRTEPLKLKAGVPQKIVLGGLKRDTSYNYRLTYRHTGG